MPSIWVKDDITDYDRTAARSFFNDLEMRNNTQVKNYVKRRKARRNFCRT